MASAEECEAVISAELDVVPQGVIAFPRVAVVIYDFTQPLAQHDTLLHQIDRTGHVVIAPYHPAHPITAAHGFSPRAFFYPTLNPYSPIGNVFWNQALHHAYLHSGRRGIFRFVIVGNPNALAVAQLTATLTSMSAQLNSSLGVMIEAYRTLPGDRYYDVADDYETALQQISLSWAVTYINGMPTWTNTLDTNSIVRGGSQRFIFSSRFQTSDPAAFNFLRARANLMHYSWQLDTGLVFQDGERIFLTFGTDGREWNRINTNTSGNRISHDDLS